MMEQLSAFISIIATTSTIKKISISGLFFSGVFLYWFSFIPEDTAKALNILEFIKLYGDILAGSGILLIGLSIVLFIREIGKYVIIRCKNHKKNKKLHKPLHNLTPEEKAYLSPYIKDNKKTIHASINNSVMSGLCDKKIIRIFIMKRNCDICSYMLLPWVKEYLEIKPRLLDNPAEIDQDFIRNSNHFSSC